MKTLVFALLSLFLFSCTNESSIPQAEFLLGTWKVDGEEQFELWENDKDGVLSGYTYVVKNDEKIISETFRIYSDNENIILEATVPLQNEGKPIDFVLNKKITDYLSFENMEHDFPKKVLYKKIHPDTVHVSILGDKGRGVTYNQIKQ